MKVPRILQFGDIGQVGIEMIAAARAANIPLRAVSLEEANFTSPDDVARTVHEAEADIVVNAAAYTAVDKAESEEALARTINTDTVGVLAKACAARGLALIHVSTDYVFDGAKTEPYLESDTTNPLGVYGRTKRDGELAVQAANPRHVILRTSWVYSAHGSNFVKTMLRLGAERDKLNVVADQHGAPTAAADLAQSILTVARKLHGDEQPGQYGIFHYTGAGETTWHGFTEEIFKAAHNWANIKATINPIGTSDYPTAARRPLSSRLNCGKIERQYYIVRTPWQTALSRVLNELRAQKMAGIS